MKILYLNNLNIEKIKILLWCIPLTVCLACGGGGNSGSPTKEQPFIVSPPVSKSTLINNETVVLTSTDNLTVQTSVQESRQSKTTSSRLSLESSSSHVNVNEGDELAKGNIEYRSNGITIINTPNGSTQEIESGSLDLVPGDNDFTVVYREGEFEFEVVRANILFIENVKPEISINLLNVTHLDDMEMNAGLAPVIIDIIDSDNDKIHKIEWLRSGDSVLDLTPQSSFDGPLSLNESLFFDIGENHIKLLIYDFDPNLEINRFRKPMEKNLIVVGREPNTGDNILDTPYHPEPTVDNSSISETESSIDETEGNGPYFSSLSGNAEVSELTPGYRICELEDPVGVNSAYLTINGEVYNFIKKGERWVCEFVLSMIGTVDDGLVLVRNEHQQEYSYHLLSVEVIPFNDQTPVITSISGNLFDTTFSGFREGIVSGTNISELEYTWDSNQTTKLVLQSTGNWSLSTTLASGNYEHAFLKALSPRGESVQTSGNHILSYLSETEAQEILETVFETEVASGNFEDLVIDGTQLGLGIFDIACRAINGEYYAVEYNAEGRDNTQLITDWLSLGSTHYHNLSFHTSANELKKEIEAYIFAETLAPPNSSPPAEDNKLHMSPGLYILGSTSKAIEASAYELPFVTGGAVRVWWDTIEPNPGEYDFSFIDQEIETAAKHGKKVTISIADISLWAIELGAESYNYLEKNVNRDTEGETFTAIVKYDPIVIERYKLLMNELAVRYSDEPTIAHWHIFSRVSNDLPEEILDPSGAVDEDGNIVEVNFIDVFDYDPDMLLEVLKDLTHYYMNLFPNTPLWNSPDVIRFEPEASGLAKNHVGKMFAAWGTSTYPNRFGVWREDLNDCSSYNAVEDENGPWSVMIDYPCRSGIQMVSSINNSFDRMNKCSKIIDDGTANSKRLAMEAVFAEGLELGIRYYEVYKPDITDPDLSEMFNELHNLIIDDTAFNCETEL